MSGTYKKSTANSIFRGYKTTLERAKYDINKNFGQMDFANADARNEMEEHVVEMIRSCETLLTEMERYTFS